MQLSTGNGSFDTVAVIETADPVNHPGHYGKSRFGVECIRFTERMTFNAGNAFKYIWRHAEKNGIEDLDKAMVYLRWCVESGRPASLTTEDQQILEAMFKRHIYPVIKDEKSLIVYTGLGNIITASYSYAGLTTAAKIHELTEGK